MIAQITETEGNLKKKKKASKQFAAQNMSVISVVQQVNKVCYLGAAHLYSSPYSCHSVYGAIFLLIKFRIQDLWDTFFRTHNLFK